MVGDTVGGSVVELQREVAELGGDAERLRGVLREVLTLARGSAGGPVVGRIDALRDISAVAMRGLLGGSVSREKGAVGNK